MIETREQFDHTMVELTSFGERLRSEIAGLKTGGYAPDAIASATDAEVTFRQGMHEEAVEYAQNNGVNLDGLNFPASPVEMREKFLASES